jgi:hypothetical protein
VYTFKKGAAHTGTDAKDAVAKMAAGKADKANPVQGVYLSTNNLTYVSGGYTKTPKGTYVHARAAETDVVYFTRAVCNPV